MKNNIIWLYITVFINMLGFAMIFPVLPLMARAFGATTFQIGLIITIASLTQFLFAPIIGKLSDKHGRKPVFSVGLVLSICAYTLYATVGSLPFVYLAAFVHGLAFSSIFPIILAYVADKTNHETRGAYMSKVTATYALGFMFGPAFGGFLSQNGYQYAFYGAIALSALNLAILLFFVPESLTKKEEKIVLSKSIVNIRAMHRALKTNLGVLFVALFAWSFYIANFELATPFFGDRRFEMSSGDIGILFSFAGIMAAATQWFILPSVIKRFDDRHIVFAGMGLIALGQFLVPFASSLFIFYAVMALTILGSASSRPTLNVMVSERAREGQGATMGLAFSFESLGRIIGPLLLGLLITAIGISVPYWVTAGVLLLALALFWKAEYRK